MPNAAQSGFYGAGCDIDCLRCGERGPWTTDAYASSRAMIEQGKVCPSCAIEMREMKAMNLRSRVYAHRWAS